MQAVAEAARVAVVAIAVAKAENSIRHEGAQNAWPKIGEAMVTQPTFN